MQDWELADCMGNMSAFYPVDLTQLPKELAGVEWPPGERK
jgi:hypothetical protein